MSITVTTLISELRTHCGEDDVSLPDTDAELLLNRAYWEIIDKYRFREKETTIVFQTIVGTRNYNMPQPFEAVRQISIEDLNTFQHTIIKKMTELEYEGVFNNNPDGTSQNKPTHYVREGCFARLWPTPDNVYNITLKYWTVLADLDEVTNNTPQIPQSWHEIILLGAVWRCYFRGGDYERSASAEKYYLNKLNAAVTTESKEEGDNHFAGVRVYRRDSGYTGAQTAVGQDFDFLSADSRSNFTNGN